MAFSKPLVAASSRPMILAILQEGTSYGYKIIQRVREISGGQMEWADGMLYPVLHRLEKEKLIQSQWMQSEEGRHRKYYSITELGKETLHQEKEAWISMNQIMLNLWDLKPAK
ncbi:MAG: helix-turn-helix transcriptional regulator [bacterium]|nr:helix-turn-helix transcriptional regulator [bacterium]